MNKQKILNKFIILTLFVAIVISCVPATVKAGYGGQGEVLGGVSGDINISLESIGFDDHRGMKAYINGHEAFCIQRGYPFRSSVSELQMVTASEGYHSGTIASLMRYLLIYTGENGAGYFRGFGTWEMNQDHTDARQTSTAGAPSSLAWQEAFDEDMEDNEDEPYENRYQNDIETVRRWSEEVKELMTGHEGCLEPFKTQMKKITYQEAGFDTTQLYAQAMMHYYIYDDPDASGYSDDAKYQCEQAVDWSIQYKFITTTGLDGSVLMISYNNSDGYYGVSRSQYYSGSCDGYIKTTIGGQYEALKLYRQVVWKTVNMRQIPSFAEDNPNNCEPIKLYWDEGVQKYTATISDGNGVLDYFNFEIPGVAITNNGDGTLTITSDNEINGELTSLPKASRLEPEDGVFKLPEYYRWNLEGKNIKYTYTVLVPLGDGFGTVTMENGDGRIDVPAKNKYQHSHEWGCAWYCTNGDEPDRCNGNKNNCSAVGNNAGWVDGHYTRHEYSASCAISCSGSDNAGWVDGHYTRHEHTSACHVHEDIDGTGCYHRNYCPYYAKEKSLGGLHTWVTCDELYDCRSIWACGKEHYDTRLEDITGQYIDWQDISGVYADGQKLIDPTFAYIKVTTVPHEFPAQTDTEILLIADNDEWNDLTYTLPDGEIIRHSSHLRVGEKFHLKYIYSYEGASKGFKIEFTLENKPYYQYNYLSRMQAPQSYTPIYNLRTGLGGDRFSMSSISVPHAKLVIEETPITIRGLYTTPETAYTLNGAYTWDSGITWNDSIYLDALTTDQFDDWYDNKSADDYVGLGEKIMTTNGAAERTDFRVTKQDDEMLVIWIYDTEPEVFSSALVSAASYIDVEDNENHTKTYFDEAYSYAKDSMSPTAYTNWFYDFEDHNNIGGAGYFSSEYLDPNGTQDDKHIPSHTVFTQNNEYRTYAVRNKVWQSDVDIQVSNFVQNTGAGIT